MSQSIFKKLGAVALAAGLLAMSAGASASTKADVAFLPELTGGFSVFGVTISASGAGSYVNSTFSSATADLLAGSTKLAWDPTAALTFTIAGNGAMTFDGLVYDNTAASVFGDIHFVNGAVKFDFNDVTLFTVSPLTPAFSTLTTGGTVSGDFWLSADGLGAVAKTLNITVPIPTQAVGKLSFTATTPAVPEPATSALALMGLAGLAMAARIGRRQAR